MSDSVRQNSTHSTPSQQGLSPAQAQVVHALAQGVTVTAAAAATGVHRTTIYHWFNTLPEFQTAAEQARQEYVATLSDQLRELSSVALTTLRSLLDDPTAPAAVRLRAALAVLQRPRFPEPDWNLPERGESPAEQRFQDEMAMLEAGVREQERREQARREARTPRNAPCPCGSGVKFKRCCGRAAPPPPPAPDPATIVT
jgi:AcrR family transcriptional regulator